MIINFCLVPVSGFRVPGSGFRGPVSSFWIPVSGCGVGVCGVGLGGRRIGMALGWSLYSCFGSSFVVGWALAPLGEELCPVTGTFESGGALGQGKDFLCVPAGWFFFLVAYLPGRGRDRRLPRVTFLEPWLQVGSKLAPCGLVLGGSDSGRG